MSADNAAGTTYDGATGLLTARKLFAPGDLIRGLRRLNASVALGLVDLSDERARIVQKLNEEGIPVSAWVLLPIR